MHVAWNFVSSFIKCGIKQLLVIYTNPQSCLLQDKEIAHHINCIVEQNHKNPMSFLVMKVNDKWACLVGQLFINSFIRFLISLKSSNYHSF